MTSQLMAMKCRVNGVAVEAEVPARLLLSDFIRHELKLTGTHVGCEMGVCGACTVVLDGDPVRSCLMFAAQVDGCDLTTVEALAADGRLSALQQMFHEYHALQCGFCTPGILMTLQALADQQSLPADESGIRQILSGNICRCTGYQNIVDAVLAFAR
jgi:aerobic-type carbon monoxide dehydrogenase small subunit (CoxS/CutS family)